MLIFVKAFIAELNFRSLQVLQSPKLICFCSAVCAKSIILFTTPNCISGNIHTQSEHLSMRQKAPSTQSNLIKTVKQIHANSVSINFDEMALNSCKFVCEHIARLLVTTVNEMLFNLNTFAVKLFGSKIKAYVRLRSLHVRWIRLPTVWKLVEQAKRYKSWSGQDFLTTNQSTMKTHWTLVHTIWGASTSLLLWRTSSPLLWLADGHIYELIWIEIAPLFYG